MISTFLFQNYVAMFHQATVPTSSAVILSHGFPSQPFEDPKLEKNWDLAQMVNDNLGVDSFLMHYSGLGKSHGEFSFLESVQDSLKLSREIQARFKYDRIHLIGHSWGGLITMNIYAALPVALRGAVVLLSPFTIFPDDEVLEAILREIDEESDIPYRYPTMEAVVADFQSVKHEHSPIQLVDTHGFRGDRFMILQAQNDGAVPEENTRRFVSRFSTPPVYEEVQTDHKFLVDRDMWLSMIIKFLREQG